MVVVVERVWNQLDGVEVEQTDDGDHLLVADQSVTDQRLARRFLCIARTLSAPPICDFLLVINTYFVSL